MRTPLLTVVLHLAETQLVSNALTLDQPLFKSDVTVNDSLVLKIILVRQVTLRFRKVNDVLVIRKLLIGQIGQIASHIVSTHVIPAHIRIVVIFRHRLGILLNNSFLEAELVLYRNGAEFLKHYHHAVAVTLLEFISRQV